MGLFFSPVYAQYALDEPMTLEGCVNYALQNNPNLQAVKMDELAGEYQIKEIKASGLPQISANGQFVDNFALPSQILPGDFFGQPGESIAVKFGTRYNMTGTVEANQLLFNKSFFTGLKAAKVSQELYQMNTFKNKEDLIYNIAQIYLQLQITDRQKDILTANLERIDQLLEITQVQFEEGIVKKIDVDQLRVNRTNLLTEKQNAELGYSQQLNLLKFYMGMDIRKDLQVAEFVEENQQYPLSDQLVLAENTNLRLLEKQQALTMLELENIRAGYYPSLSAFARYGYQSQTDKLLSSKNGEGSGFWTGSWGLTLQVPIFDGFQKKNQVQQNIIRQDQLRLDIKQATLSSQMEFVNASDEVQLNKALITQQKANMELAEELYGVSSLSYQEGVAPLTELLNAETSLKEAQTQYLTALLQLHLAELDHLKTSGQLAMLIKKSGN
ncbi:MAG: transporter [Saprospiraceae bacterium]|nr:MAG: transporter [Saprospiraceae bacterium]